MNNICLIYLPRSSWANAAAAAATVFVATKEKIKSFALLPSGWHYGGGMPPPAERIKNAEAWHEKLVTYGFAATDAFPGADGEIMISAYRDNHVFELVLEADDTLSFYHEHNDATLTSLSHKGISEIEATMTRVAGELWSILGSFTNETLTLEKIGSIGWRLKTLEEVARSFNTIAFCKQRYHYAPTYENTIPQLLVSRQYSGNLKKADYPQIAN
jgi:hypothetical protein